jgi:uncharacterized protein
MNDKDTHIPTPCTGLCIMDDKNRYCKGCMRTNEEILNWGHYSVKEKKEILNKIAERRGKLP